MNVFFQVIQNTLCATNCIFMSKLDAKEVGRKNYEMFEFNYVKGQMKCAKQHLLPCKEKWLLQPRNGMAL